MSSFVYIIHYLFQCGRLSTANIISLGEDNFYIFFDSADPEMRFRFNAVWRIVFYPSTVDIFTTWADSEEGRGGGWSGPPENHKNIWSRGGGGWSGPPVNYKNIGSLCNASPDPLNNHKSTKPAFNVGPSSVRQRNAISMAFR